MKRILSVVAVFCAVSAFGQRELPVHRGRLTSDLNAGGYNITNLAPGFAASIGALTNAAQFATPADVAAATSGISVAESDPIAMAALSNLTVSASGGYATEVFWYPTFQDSSATFGTNVVHDDITMLLADSQSRVDKRLVVAVDERPTVDAIEPPEGSWSLEPGAEGVAVLSDDVLVAQGGVGTARAIFTTTDGDSKLVVVPFRNAQAGTVLFKPSGEIAGTFRHGVSTNVIAHFSAANTNAISTYRFHRETSHGTNGVSTWTFPNCFQLYEAGGVNTDAPKARSVRLPSGPRLEAAKVRLPLPP